MPFGLIFCSVLISYVLGLHFVFLRAIPDPLFHPDSAAYLKPSLEFLTTGRFTVTIERSCGYPYFLLGLLKASPSLSVVLWSQHLLLLITAGLSGFFFYRFFYPSSIWAVMIFCWTAISPLSMWASHSILTETVYSFFCVLGVGMLFWARQQSRWGPWVLLGLVVPFALWIRPSGWALFVGCVVGLLWPQTLNQRRAFLGFGVAFIMGFSAFCCESFLQRGYWGLARFTGMTLFGATAQFLDLEKVSPESTRRALEPFYHDKTLRQKLPNKDWVRYGDDGPVRALVRSGVRHEALDRTLVGLSRQAFSQRPISFLAGEAKDMVSFFWQGFAIPEIYLTRQYTFFVYRGLDLFWRFTESIPSVRPFLIHTPTKTAPYQEALNRWMHAADQEEAAAAVAEMNAKDFFRYERVLILWKPLKVFFVLWGSIPLFTLLATMLSWHDKRVRGMLIILWVVILGHIALSVLSAPDPRYGVALEPLFFMGLAAGGKGVSERFAKMLRHP